MKKLVLLSMLSFAFAAYADDADAGAAPAKPAGPESTCKAANADGSELIAETTVPGKTCVKPMMDKVKEAKCADEAAAGTKITYLLFTKNAKGEYPEKGTNQSVTCPKAKKK
jgi:hypothetical protein